MRIPRSSLARLTNDAGQPLSRQEDHDADGVPDAYCSNWAYNSDGQLTEYTYSQDCDGTFSQCEQYTYDDQGRLSEVSSGTLSGCVSGACTRYEYSQDGLSVLVIDDSQCNGERLSCYEETYDEEGRLIGSANYVGCGEEKNLCSESEYSDDGMTQWVRFDSDCDGVNEKCGVRHSRPNLPMPQGRFNLYELDHDCDGQGDAACEVEEYDQDGNLIYSFYNQGCFNQGQNLICAWYEYDEQGRRISQIIDRNCFDQPQRECSATTYDHSW